MILRRKELIANIRIEQVGLLGKSRFVRIKMQSHRYIFLRKTIKASVKIIIAASREKKKKRTNIYVANTKGFDSAPLSRHFQIGNEVEKLEEFPSRPNFRSILSNEWRRITETFESNSKCNGFEHRFDASIHLDSVEQPL